MLGYYYGFDWTYLVLVVPCVILALWAQHNVNATFTKYSSVYSRRGITGAQAAQMVLLQNDITNVRIEEISGKLTDHYEPRAMKPAMRSNMPRGIRQSACVRLLSR